MSISATQLRCQLSRLISAARQQPQVITKHRRPVAVLVSVDYFRRSDVVVKPASGNSYSQLLQLRKTYAPQDDIDLAVSEASANLAAWKRVNSFTGHN